MINNLELIKPLLEFKNKGDFYMLYIFKRKKDQLEGEKDNHQSVRTIKTYCITSIEYLEKRWDEITHLCEYFKARSYIHITSQSPKLIGLEIIKQISERLKEPHPTNFKNIFDSVVGQIPYNEKRWIIDIDIKDMEVVSKITNLINLIQPKEILNKVITTIPTKSGYHLITTPFNVLEFNKYMSLQGDVPDIQKKNPTLLYLPNSLHNE